MQLDLNKLSEKVIAISHDAGDCIMEIYEKDFNIYEKDDKSPLTDADLAAHHKICESLTEITPHIPILSEESKAVDWSIRKDWTTYWLVDPLDGTKEFLKKNGEFTVNIALVEKGKPIMGVVFAPALRVTYVGIDGKVAWKRNSEGNQLPIQVASTKDVESYKVIGSRSHQSNEILDYCSKLGSYELIPMGSSLKICLVADGQAHIYPRLGPTMEWDTAAAHAVVNAAGGELVDLSGKDLYYNSKESLLNPNFIVSASERSGLA